MDKFNFNFLLNSGGGDDNKAVRLETERSEELGAGSAQKRCKLEEKEHHVAADCSRSDNTGQCDIKREVPPILESGETCVRPFEILSASRPEVAVKTEPSPSTSAGGRKKPQECVRAKPVENRSTFPSFRFMSTKIRLRMCAADHPRVFLTTFQLDTLAQHILDIILSPEGERVRPRFYGMSRNNGYLTLICGDHTTASWVKELPEKLVPGGIRLKVVERPADCKAFIAVGHFPKGEGETDRRILRYLEIQNEGLDCSQWKILDKNYERKSAVRMTFAIDWASAQLLKAKGPLLNFKFAGARFMLKTKNGVKFKEEDCEDDDLDFLESFPIMDEFVDPYGPFKWDSTWAMPGGSQMEFPYPGDPADDYTARVGAIVKKSKSTLRNGFTSRERYLHHRKGNRKKKKVKKEQG